MKSSNKFKGVTRQGIIDRGLLLVREEGRGSLTIHRLARELGVKPPSLYKHVSGLEEIVNELHGYALHLVTERITERLSRKKHDPVTRLEIFLREYDKFARDELGLYELMQETHVGKPENVVIKAESLLRIIFSILTDFSIPEKDLVHTARFIRSWLHGYIDLTRKHGFGLSEDLEESFQFAINTIVEAINALVAPQSITEGS